MKQKMKKRSVIFICAAALFTGGCAFMPRTEKNEPHIEDGRLLVGTIMSVEMPKELTLLDNIETLAADGLYYNTWTDGEAVPYENSDGETVDLYDAQLYLLVSECDKEETAKENYDKWLTAAKDNYNILSQEEITCSGQSYILLVYDFEDEDSPYDRGVSAFGTCGVDAVCAELTCTEDYEKDLKTILTDFLEGCHYNAE